MKIKNICCVVAGKGMAADLKYVELCARQIARVANSDKIVVE